MVIFQTLKTPNKDAQMRGGVKLKQLMAGTLWKLCAPGLGFTFLIAQRTNLIASLHFQFF